MITYIDVYGVPWPAAKKFELCRTCWQPTRNGACDHIPLAWPEVAKLIGGLPIGDGSTLRPILPDDIHRMANPEPPKVLGAHLVPEKKSKEPLPANEPAEKSLKRKQLARDRTLASSDGAKTLEKAVS